MQDQDDQGPTDVVGLDYDFWYAARLASGETSAGEEPLPMGQDGLLYYVRIRAAGWTDKPAWIDTDAFSTVQAAMEKAESMVWTNIRPAVRWD
jgi:hypothetical protein